MKKFMIITFLAIAFLSVGIFLILTLISPATTDPISDSNGDVLENSIASIEKIELGGLKQSVLIRGRNINNPVLLILHGGPGSPEMPFVRHYNKNLEKDFVVVSWDQRGAGKSYFADIPKERFQKSNFISDTHELTQYLKERFDKEKIFLLGHSWGSVIGLETILQYPDDYFAYIGIGQVVNMEEGEKISYEYTLQKAAEKNNTEALEELKEIGYPPYIGEENLEKIMTQRKWLVKFGGSLYGKTSYNEIIKVVLFCEEYSLKDKINYIAGAKKSLEMLWEPLMDTDFSHIKKVDVPVYFIAGRYDFQVPSVLAEKFYKNLDAPHKEFLWFEKSAHSPIYEESDLFYNVMVKILEENSRNIQQVNLENEN